MFTPSGEAMPASPGILVQNVANNKVCFMDNMDDGGISLNARLFKAYLDIASIKKMYE